MRLYVTLVNQGRTAPGVIRVTDDEVRPADVRPTPSFCGLAVAGGRGWAVSAGDHLVEIDLATDTQVAETELPSRLTHSIAFDGPSLVVVDTGRGRLWRRTAGHWQVVWADGYGWDEQHLNSVLVTADRTLVSGFGPGWAKGFVHDVTADERVVEDLVEPHSLVEIDGEVWFCESGRSRLRNLEGRTVEVPGGYPRGLAGLGGGAVAVGTSKQRNSYGRCGLHRVDLVTEKVIQLADLHYFGPEVYDVVSVGKG